MDSLDNGRRLIIAHNPHSSRASDVKEQVFDRLDEAGYIYETIEVRQAHLNDNVARLAPLIKPNDIILSAAGDGSAHAIFHTVIAANQPGVELGFLGYGNFNDMPNTFNTKDSLRDPVSFLEQAQSERVYPISVFADGKPVRSALLYATIGWTATAASQFDDPKVRHSITHGGAGVIKSLWRTGLYYLTSRRGSVLPPFEEGSQQYSGRTDIICANGPAVARIIRTGKHYYREQVFLYRTLDVRSVIKNIPFLLMSLCGRMKGREVRKVVLRFAQPSQLPLQCDGEVALLENVTTLEVRKADMPLRVLVTK